MSTHYIMHVCNYHKISDKEVASMAREIFINVVGMRPQSDTNAAEDKKRKIRDGLLDQSNEQQLQQVLEDPPGAMNPAQLSDALAILGLETKYVDMSLCGWIFFFCHFLFVHLVFFFLHLNLSSVKFQDLDYL